MTHELVPRRRPGSRFSHGRRLAVVAAGVAAGVLTVAAGQQAPETGMPADLRAAMAQADAGNPAELTGLADAGRADAQFYAGVMFMSGRGSISVDGERGCAYEEKASVSRADAMQLVAICYRDGVGGVKDAARAKTAFGRAAEMGAPGAKCALGQMMMAEPAGQGAGLQLCKDAAQAGDEAAQLSVGDLYFRGGAVQADHAEARKWYQMAAARKNPQAARTLGQMYATGDGGKRDIKKALELWQTAEAAGDPLACILVADQLFSDLTGGRKPEPGKFAFRGGVPVQDVQAVEDWYRAAQARDPRPEVKKRAEYALTILTAFKTAATTKVSKR